MKNIIPDIIKTIITLTVAISAALLLGCSSEIGGTTPSGIDDGRSSDFYISDISFSSGTMKYPFNAEDWVNYIEVPFGTETITVTATTNNQWAEIYLGDEMLTKGRPSNPISLTPGGTTIIEIRVIAEDSKEFIYIYYIRVLPEDYSLAALSSLVIDGVNLTPSFSTENRNYSATTTASAINLHATPAATSEGVKTEVKINGTTVTETSSISLVQGLNTITVRCTAPDGSTSETYTVSIIKQITSASAKLAALSIAGGSFNETFDPDKLSYSIDVTSTMNPVNLTAIPLSSAATISATVNNGSPVSDLTSIPLTAGIVSTIRVTVSGGNTYIITATSLQGSGNANLSGITVTMGTNCVRPVYPGTVMTHDPKNTTFNKDITDYVTVAYGFRSIKITATAEDSTVKNIEFTADGNPVSSSLTGGVCTATVEMQPGELTDISIKVTAGDGSSNKIYNLHAKLLNVEEFYWGIYSPSFDKSKSTWKKPEPGTFERDGLIPGGGHVKWVTTLSAQSNITLTNYNDGNLESNSVPAGGTVSAVNMYYPYNDGGFRLNGEMEAKLASISNRVGYNLTKNPPFELRTAQGEAFASIDYHLYVNGDTAEASDSYTDITYLGVKSRVIYKSAANKPYPFIKPYDLSVNWNDGL